MKRTPIDQTFETSDLYLAAYLVARGLRLWATHAHNQERVIFGLTPRPSPEDLAHYHEGQMVERRVLSPSFVRGQECQDTKRE
jgi:hypothetical protein